MEAGFSIDRSEFNQKLSLQEHNRELKVAPSYNSMTKGCLLFICAFSQINMQ